MKTIEEKSIQLDILPKNEMDKLRGGNKSQGCNCNKSNSLTCNCFKGSSNLTVQPTDTLPR